MLETLDKNYVLPTYARNYTNFISGQGATLKAEDGKEYIDFTSGIGVCSVGHGNEALSKTIAEQASKMLHISNLYVIEPQAKLAQKLHALSKMEVQTFFANSGAEANEGAIKIARKYGEENGECKRYKIITLQHSFHGRTITALKATGQESMHNYFGPFPDGFVYAQNIDEIENLLDEHTAAVMIELVQGEGGVEPVNKTKVQALAKTLKQKGVLLIVDEVQTGVYRTGDFLAAQHYEIEPDIITLAKGLGGGVAIGAIMTTLKGVLSAGDHGSTFGGNYLATAAAHKVLEILEEKKENNDLALTIAYFTSKLQTLLHKYPELFSAQVGVGLMLGLRVKDADTLAKIIKSAHEHGVLVLKAGRNTLRLLPPLTISETEIDEGMKRLEHALQAL